MAVLLLDFETTGLDATKDRVIEVGAMITSNDFSEVIEGISYLVHSDEHPPLTPEITGVTGITTEMLKDAISPERFMAELDILVQPYMEELLGSVAYNMPFDLGFLKSEVEHTAGGMLKGINHIMQLPFLCAMRDVEDNLKCKSWKLMHVALDHGVTVNPKELHRAINDVELMRQMLVEVGETFSNMLAYRDEPTVYVVAKVLPPWEDGGQSSGVAKSLGFSWQVAKGDESGRLIKNRWVRKIKQKDWIKLSETAPIKVELL